MNKFDGFPPGKVKMTQIPAHFFSDLLPLINDLSELKVMLFCFWALHQREGDYRYLRRRDFADNETLMAGLAAAEPDTAPESVLDAALKRTTERGALLCADVTLDTGTEQLYFVNTEIGRTAIKQLRAGQWEPGNDDYPVEILPERPNSYALYEANIGPLTPIIAEEIKDAEKDYPAEWLQEAIKLAVENEIRKWRYIRAILERWDKEGKSREIAGRHHGRDERRYITGRIADFIKS